MFSHGSFVAGDQVVCAFPKCNRNGVITSKGQIKDVCLFFSFLSFSFLISINSFILDFFSLPQFCGQISTMFIHLVGGNGQL